MSEFLVRSACRGRRPPCGVSSRRVSRPALIARLLRERHVARFLVAPDKFGKTNLALEYADTVFSFEHVFWVDGKSPCFLRDVDEGCIASVLLATDEQPFLVVFEDVPPLDPQRAERFSREIDVLLDRDCEVLATCVPTCDVFERHRDRIKLTACDLLLSDEEMDALRLPASIAAEPARSIAPSRRVAGLVWCPDEARTSFLEAALHEEFPGDVLLALFVMLVLQDGELHDLGSFGAFDDAQAAFFAENYPYLGVDVRRGRFDAAPFSVDELFAAFVEKLDAMARRSLQAKRDVLAARLADVLLGRRRLSRACDVVRLLAARPTRASWLASWGEELLEGACLLPATEAYRSLAGERAGLTFRLAADEAVRRALLNDPTGACESAQRVMSVATAPLRDRALAALVVANCGSADARLRANDVLEGLVAAGEGGAASVIDPSDANADADAVEWTAAAHVLVALSSSCAEAADRWLSWRERGARGALSLVSASWVLSRALSEGAEADRSVERLGVVVRACVCDAGEPMGLSCALAGMAYERACDADALSLHALDARTAAVVGRAEVELFNQCTAFERAERDLRDARRLYAATHPDVARPSSSLVHGARTVALAPMLTVNLFGGLEVYIGEDRVETSRMRRKKTQTLLALLVLNRGHELPRSRLYELLWPNSNPDSARRNFYSVSSELRRALTTPEGTCPYLIRRQQGLRLDPALLQSDVEDMEDVCRTLLFEQPGFGGWAHLYEQVDRRFSEDIVPGDGDNEAIAGIRVDYRNRLVDALVAAARRLVAAGDVQEGLWFARAALQRDRTREDAYAALMQAQAASGQRAAALDTYFSCRRFLSEELGIDPDPSTMRIYHDIIETGGAM